MVLMEVKDPSDQESVSEIGDVFSVQEEEVQKPHGGLEVANSLLEMAYPNPSTSQDKVRSPRTALCFTLLIILFLISIGFIAGAMYMHTLVFMHDLKWNEMLEKNSTFPGSVDGDTYFKGKMLHEIPVFNSAILPPKLWKLFVRKPALEIVALALKALFLLCALLHLIAFIFSKTFRDHLKITYLGYGISAFMLFIGAILLLLSAVGVIPAGFISIRIYLEDGLMPGDQLKVVDVDDEDHIQFQKEFCEIQPNATNHEAQVQLLAICKLCAYKYAAMSHLDPCLHSPAHELMFNNRTYDYKDLEALRICPVDDLKLCSFGMMILGVFFCLLTMWLGSNAEVELLEPHYHDYWEWHPKSVTGIHNWSPRTFVPSSMEIPMVSNASATLVAQIAGNNKEHDVGGIRPAQSAGLSSGTSLGSIQRVNSVVMQAMKKGAHTIMHFPSMVIHPPHLRYRGNATPHLEASTTVMEPEESKELRRKARLTWFDDYE